MATDLIKGYLTDRVDEATMSVVETIYFVDHDGTVYSSGERPRSNWFDRPGTVWTRVDALPQGSECIGNYKRPNMVVA